MNTIDLNNIQHIHFVGIGGSGVSSLAQLMHLKGMKVSGSDKELSIRTEKLRSLGISIAIGNDFTTLPEATDLLVYSPAVPEADSERTFASDSGITQLSYPEFLGVLSNNYPISIAVSGTNGKTTTSTMVAELLEHLNCKPNVIVGAYMQKFTNNTLLGSDEYLVMESCEYRDSFLSIHHNICVITNIDEDHLDYFKDLNHIKASFKKFVTENKKGDGVLVCNTDHSELQEIVAEAREAGMKVINYGAYQQDIEVRLPGSHNKENGAAALGVIKALNLDMQKAKTYLKDTFVGPQRRFEFLGTLASGTLVYDDYAHNPEGLDLLINGLRSLYPEKKIVMLFEPHLYSRSREFKDGFGRSLAQVDELYLLETYQAREVYNSDEAFFLADYIDEKGVDLHLVHHPETLVHYLREKKYNDSHIIVSAGAGDVWQHTHHLIDQSR